MPPNDEEDDDPEEVDDDGDGDDPSDSGADTIEAGGQRLVRLDRHRRTASPASSSAAPVETRSTPRAAPTRRRRPKKATTPHAATLPVTDQATPVAPPLPQPQPAPVVVATSSAAEMNVFLAFEETLKLHPAAAQTIAVERKTGTPVQWMITSRPRTANELYDAVKRLHGRSVETTYEVTFRDGAGHGSGGQVSMPSTVDDLLAPPPPPGQPHVQPHWPQAPAYAPTQPQPYAQPPLYAQSPPAYPPQPQQQPPTVQVVPPAVDPVTMMQEVFKLLEQMRQTSVQPQPQMAPPTPMPQVAPQPAVDPMAAMQQTFDLFRQMQAAVQPPPQPAPPPQMPPPPPQGSDPAVMMAWMNDAFRLFRQMQASATPSPQPAPQAPTQPQPTPQMMGMPPIQAPPGTMFVPGFGFVPTDRLFAALSGPAPSDRAPSPSGGPYRPRPPSPWADPRDPSAPPYERPPYQPPQRPKTASEELRDAVSVMRSTFEVAREFGGFGAPAAEPPPPPDEDDSPVKVIDMGPAKGVINRSDGSLRGFETAMANLPDILGWIGKQGEAIRRARADERRQQQQQLPPGYVMAGPDYQPPDGYVAVPVCRHGRPISDCPDEQCRGGVQGAPQQAQAPAQAPLPEPPAEMPPPIAASEPLRPKPTWGMPGGER